MAGSRVLIPRVRRLGSLVVIAAIATALSGITPAAASGKPMPATPAQRSAAPSQRSAAAVNPVAHASPETTEQRLAQAASNPCGGSAYACADGHFYAFRGNPSVRCGWIGNAPTLGTCTNKNYEVANFGYRCSGCDWIRMYWGSSYTGAYICIPPGYIYSTYNAPGLRFNRGAGLSGYGQTVWYNAASAKWTGPC
jgi:hypothetical protein